jgi:two-component sensor histidine kinase/CheY-like chemotaxis protein
MKVVMVDDSAGDRTMFRLHLEEMVGRDLAFEEASTGAAGEELCRSARPDCVLLDYRLPDMNGLEFLARVRKHEPEVPSFAVVVLTGLSGEQTAVEAMKAGAQDYLVKDRVTPEGLMSAVRRATEKVGLLRALKDERDRIAASLAEKEILLKEVHHRVKNNLQVIASLLRLQADSFGESALADALHESQHRVESMALVHEQLYETDDLREIDLPKQVDVLTANLFRSYGEPARISWTSSIEPVAFGVDRAIPISLILNELISNAFKHAFPGGRSGSLAIEGKSDGDRFVLSVRDDGAGMPETVRPKSLGLEIVRILTRQLKGSFEIERGQGTAFRISIPQNVQ